MNESPMPANLRRSRSERRAVAVVCAKNEAPRIGAVLSALVPVIPTLVIDDGSDDDTAEVARRAGADVLRLPENVGKGQAMLAGVRMAAQAGAHVVLFVDADLSGFRSEYVRLLVEPVIRGTYGMVVGMRDYGAAKNEADRKTPLISGERAVSMDILRRMPPQGWQGYGVEIWLNHIAAETQAPVGTVRMPGTSVAYKWEKEGMQRGVSKMADMAAEVVAAHESAARASQSNQQLAMSLRASPLASPHMNHAMDYARGAVVPAPLPTSFTARGASTEEVMNALSKSIVDASAPYVRDELWTAEARNEVGSAIGRKLAAPIWTVACAACAFFFGPIVGIAATAGAVLSMAPATSQKRTR